MNIRFYILFEIISFAVLFASIVGSILYSRSKKEHRFDFTTLHFLTAGVFLASCFMFIPIYYHCYSFGDNYSALRPILLSIHNSLRMFILDGEFDIIVNALDGTPLAMHAVFSLYAAILYVMAPLLTFSNILSLFKDLHEMWRLKRSVRHPIYIFSELNDISLALAKSIKENYVAAQFEVKLRKRILANDIRVIKGKPRQPFLRVKEMDMSDPNAAADPETARKQQEADLLTRLRSSDYPYKGDNEKTLIDEAKAHAKKDIATIKRNHGAGDRAPVLAFTDVFTNNDETDFELQQKAHELRAICLKRDITRLSFNNEKTHVEFFLLGENESENIEQALNLTEQNKTQHNRSIYLYSSKTSAGIVLDSISKGECCVNEELLAQIDRNPYVFLRKREVPDNAFDKELYVRRINHGELLAMRTLLKPELLELFAFDTVSITILGAGSYGKRFLQTAIWLYQETHHRLEINVFDSSPKNTLLSALRREMPEIVTDDSGHYVRDKFGDCQYDIQFYTDIDFFSFNFEAAFLDPAYSERLKRTKMVIVALGDDDRNIEAAIGTRALFDRILNITGKAITSTIEATEGKPLTELTEEQLKYRLPYIDAIVFDERKSANLSVMNHEHTQTGLVNYRKEPLRINFIGSLSEQYSYNILNEYKALERKALRYHMEWIYHNNIEALNAYESEHGTDNDENALANDVLEGSDEAKDLKKLRDDLRDAMTGYASYEYFRRSSISRALHQRFLKRIHSTLKYNVDRDHPTDCKCAECLAASTLEHARWNAFMRVMGYRYSPTRDDRGMVHFDLVPWDDLSDADKAKDHKIVK